MRHYVLLLAISLLFSVDAFTSARSSGIMSSRRLLGKVARQPPTHLKATPSPIPGVGDDGCALPSPSRINTLPVVAQAASFFAIAFALYAGTLGSVNAFEQLKISIPSLAAGILNGVPLNGLLFTAAGVAHFTICDEFCNMMPVQGAWGFWYLPGSKKFHVIWTGIAEIIFGLWLTLGGAAELFGFTLPASLGPVTSDASLALLLLTILVTPANIYMLTHGAKLPKNGPEIPVVAHVIRLILQVVLFTTFYEKALPTIALLKLNAGI
jgi:uncharacterized membrane protein